MVARSSPRSRNAGTPSVELLNGDLRELFDLSSRGRSRRGARLLVGGHGDGHRRRSSRHGLLECGVDLLRGLQHPLTHSSPSCGAHSTCRQLSGVLVSLPLTLRSARPAKQPGNEPRHPTFGKPEHGALAVPPDNKELETGRNEPDERAKASREGRLRRIDCVICG